jgi:cyclin-dependent kinase 12/13
MWSTGCILGELYNRRPIFRAENEIDQLDAISRVCGTPTPAAWPTVHECRLFDTMQFKKVYPRLVKEHFRQKFPEFPPDGVDLLDQLLILDPSKRITSSRALQVQSPPSRTGLTTSL